MKQMTKEECAKALALVFPEKRDALIDHYDYYGFELLAHIFFDDEITAFLFPLLVANTQKKLIKRYCSFIEIMWLEGNEAVRNVVNVSILGRLSKDANVWDKFGNYLSSEFKADIYDEVVIPNMVLAPAAR